MNDTIYWPAEWATQDATWISWPHNLETWPGRFTPIPDVFERFIRSLAEVQLVNVLLGPPAVREIAVQRLGAVKNVKLHAIETNDVWIRDYGPTFVSRQSQTASQLVGVDWQYNAWGGKYPPFDKDAQIAGLVCDSLDCERLASPMFCEGGALDGNGAGTLMTTSSCLLSATRNPGWEQSAVEAELSRCLGVTQVLWVDGGGLLGDDTDGHIDQLARFVSESDVVVAVSSVDDDPNRAGLERNVEILESARNASGQQLRVHRLPTPPPRFIGESRVPESYCNFLIANDLVIVPTFENEATDAQAIELLASFFPSRQIVPLVATDLIWGLGAFHCASQQQPRAVPMGRTQLC